jgi:hypothetical protein
MPNVYELTLGFNNIVQGNPLIFPNVLTCMAFVVSNGANLVGVHFTQLDQSAARINGAWARVTALMGGPYHVYAAGPRWNANLLTNIAPPPASMNAALTPAGIDIRATLAPGGGVTLERRPAGAGAWVAVPLLP